MRKVWIALAVIFFVAAAGAYYAFTNLDYFVEVAIERAGSDATQTRVSVDGVTLALEKGQGTVRGLSVANPPNYPSGAAIKLGEVEVIVNPGQSGLNLVVLDRVKVSDTVVQYLLGPGTSNLDVIRRNASRAGVSPDESTMDPLIKIRRLTISDGSIRIRPRDGEMFEIALPDITLNNVGGAKGGTSAAVASEVVQAVTQQVLMVTARAEIQRRLGALTDELDENLTESVGEAIEGLLGR